ncbi:UNVERIFIED_CONTAM: hypothetical protein Sangu_1004900 [Sesamum angustifolium]|uniref:Uncharacterized protein n=1 Tax=Sesamum angustifolium TaxID=2727405 RepID=A0AAW2PHY9_9LAMI
MRYALSVKSFCEIEEISLCNRYSIGPLLRPYSACTASHNSRKVAPNINDSSMFLDIEFQIQEVTIRFTRLHNSKFVEPGDGLGKLPSTKRASSLCPKIHTQHVTKPRSWCRLVETTSIQGWSVRMDE